MFVGTVSGLVDVGSGRVTAFEGRDVRSLAGPWVVLDGREVTTTDEPRPAGRIVDGYDLICIGDGAGGAPWVGTAEAHLLRLDGEPRVVDAFEAAEGRDRWYTPWGGPPDVRSISVTPAGTVLVNVHVGGIVRSDDDGASWRPTIDIDHDVHEVLGLEGGEAVAACAHGLATSTDDGVSWQLHDDGLHATYARAVAVSGDTVLLSASTGPGSRQAAVYRRPIGGDSAFERCRTGLREWLEGNVNTSWLAGAPDGTAAFATAAGDVYVSTDEGATWERAAAGLPSVRCLTLG